MNTILEIAKSARAFAESHPNAANEFKGFYAGDGREWLKCSNYESALASKMPYIFFIDSNKETFYQS